MLGRDSGSSSPGFLPISEKRNISRRHAEIVWNPQIRKWEFRCLSKNGMFVDGVFYKMDKATGKTPTVTLRDQACLDVVERKFFFLYPKVGAQAQAQGKAAPTTRPAKRARDDMPPLEEVDMKKTKAADDASE